VLVTSQPCFPEPPVENLAWGRYSERADQVGWLGRSTLTRAKRIREFLNRSLAALPDDAAEKLCHRLHDDPPFAPVFFELVVGRFLQVLGAEVDFEPVGDGGRGVDWRATFSGGEVVYVEATSPLYNQRQHQERLRREALLGIIEEEMPPGWWVIPRSLPRLELGASRRSFRRTVRELLRGLPDDSALSIENRHRVRAGRGSDELILELWPDHDNKPTGSPIAMVSMGAGYDDSSLRVAVAARAKRHQARAFPGQAVLLAIDAPFMGPDVEDFDSALLGHTVLTVSLETDVTWYSFRPDGALTTQRAAEYAGVLAFGHLGVSGSNEPILYPHPRFLGTLPAPIMELRRRWLDASVIVDEPAARTRIMDGLGFAKLHDLDE